MKAKVWKKDPSDTEDFTIVWGGSPPTEYILETGESIVTSMWILPLDLIEVSATFDAVSTTIFVSGGTIDERYILTNEITVDSGRTLNRSVYLDVEELFAQ